MCVDVNGIFTTVYSGEARRFSDGAVCKASNLGKLLDNDKLHIPKQTQTPNDSFDFLFYLIGDEAFPLQIYIMRPYPKRVLNNKNPIFNYRMSRGWKRVESVFGMLTSKFEKFQRPLICQKTLYLRVYESIRVYI